MNDKSEQDQFHDQDERDQKILELQDTILRLRAEIDNINRFASKERENLSLYAIQDFVSGLLPIFDTLEIASKENEGVKVIWQMMQSELKKQCVELILPEQGQTLDPTRHEVLQQDASFPNNTITSAVQSGYLLHDRVVRPARVIVGSKKDSQHE